MQILKTLSVFNVTYYFSAIDVNECASNNGGCSVLADCINTAGSFACTCKNGYIGDGFNCTGKLISI